MKKICILLLIILTLTSCTNKPNETKKLQDNLINDNDLKQPVEPVEEPYIDTNPIKVGLYQNGKLVTNLETTIASGIDIASFDVYYTNDQVVDSTNTKYNFNKYYKNYENIDNYKIGFYISFEVDNEKVEATILDPSAMYKLSPYIFNYLYDDIHQPDGSWYSHVETKDVKENTIYSSIKLYAVDEINKVSSPITITVFTYDSKDDFDENGYYRGNSKYTATIIKK